jgi:hypothetical protein
MRTRWADWFFQQYVWLGVIAVVLIVALLVDVIFSWWQERR